MSLVFDAAYFGDVEESGGLRHDAGYSDYLALVEEKPYKLRLKKYVDLIPDNAKILELGAGVGKYGQLAELPLIADRGITWTCVDSSDWCFNHKLTNNFIKEDVLTYLQSQADDAYDFIVSIGFIECFTDVELAFILTEAHRVAKTKQYHITYREGTSKDTWYNTKSEDDWNTLINNTKIVVKHIG